MYKMRVALCISGFLRENERAYPSIKSQFLDKFHPDVFISTYDVNGYWSDNDQSPIRYGNKVDLERVKKLYNPKYLECDEYSSELEATFLNYMGPNLRMRWGRTQNIVGMYWKIWKCNNLKIKYETENKFKYDIVIRIRPDTIFDNIVCENVVKNTLNIIVNNSLIADWFFYGNSDVMNDIASIYVHMKDIYEKGCLFDPHDLLLHGILFFSIQTCIMKPFNHMIFNTPKGYCLM